MVQHGTSRALSVSTIDDTALLGMWVNLGSLGCEPGMLPLGQHRLEVERGPAATVRTLFPSKTSCAHPLVSHAPMVHVLISPGTTWVLFVSSWMAIYSILPGPSLNSRDPEIPVNRYCIIDIWLCAIWAVPELVTALGTPPPRRTLQLHTAHNYWDRV